MITSFRGRYFFLSNMYQVVQGRIQLLPHQTITDDLASKFVIYNGAYYISSEHAYQAAKTFDLDLRTKISSAKDPFIAKRLGRQVPSRKMVANWEDIKLVVMRDILISKFNIPYLREKLIATGSQDLIEGNNWGDTFWGVCRGKGENHLGKLLMDIRSHVSAR